MHRTTASSLTEGLPPAPSSPPGSSVPTRDLGTRTPFLLTPAARKDLRNRMLLFRQTGLDRIAALTGAGENELRRYRRELSDSDLSDRLLQRGASLAYTRELPQAALLYLLVRAARPQRVVETGVGPGYSSTWILAGLEANGKGELFSLGPGSPNGRSRGLGAIPVGSFVPLSLRPRWTLVLGNTEERLADIVRPEHATDLFFSDNGPDPDRARFELHHAWDALAPNGLLLAHHIDSNPAWGDFCRAQGLPLQVLDPGPPALGALSVRTAKRATPA
ncbi:MAG: class I SAM-dependent methyltransferase [Thermoplasmata archaeon]|nr:class I SAM-dependent methyltransferase [Thermoplasmata archaeon]